ncbi:hypothetical protein GPALN_005441 [Globodera pallida]|nr:hypothetical protein GPALN_005441 [Globodera pallida]
MLPNYLGWKSNTLNFLCLVAAFLLCFAHFEHLQTDADYKLFELRNLSIKFHSDYLSGIVHYGHMISAIMFLLHVASIKLSKTRFTFLGLLAVLSWPALFFVHYEQINQRDYLISRLALSAFTLLISTAILFLPKKPKRKKRPNTFCSAFSVASTPLSQRSRFTQSQCSWNTNLTHERTKNRTEDFEDDVHSLSSKRYMKIGASEQHNGIRSRACFDKTKTERDAFDSMSLRSGKIVERSYAPSLGSFSAHSPAGPSKSFGWREKRDQTPLHEVNQLIDDLLIYSTDDSTENESVDCVEEFEKQMEEITDRRLPRTNTPFKTPGKMMLSERAISPGRKRRHGQQGPFTSLTYNPAVRKIASGFSEQSSPFVGGLLGSKPVPSSFSRDGSSYSSLSNSNTNSPFRHL